MKTQYIPLSIYFCFFFQTTNTQIHFEHFTIENGLSNNSVREIFQSENGYMWFGTLNGINRFDGKNFRTFTFEPGNLNSLSSNRIQNFFEDGDNYIWIITFDKQVLRFDPVNERFINLNLLFPEGSFSEHGRVKIYSSSPDVIWVASENCGIIRIIQQKGSDNFTIDVFNAGNIIPSDEYTFICKDKNEKIWIGTQKGLVLLENDTINLNSPVSKKSHIVNSEFFFTASIEIENGNLLFGTRNNGIYEYSNGTLKPWYAIKEQIQDIFDIEQGKNNDILITTDGNGCYYLDKDGKLFHFTGKTNKSYFDIYRDHTGAFWILTASRGIALFNPENITFKHFGLNEHFRESPGEEDKQIVLEDSNGDIWIGIFGGGLCKFDRQKQKFDFFYQDINNSHSLSSNFILSLYEDNSNNLWIGTFQDGLNKLEHIQNNFQYKLLILNATYNSQNEVRSITEDQEQRLWIGTKSGNIFCCDRKNNILFQIPEDIVNKKDYIKSNAYALLVDGNDLWIGTKGNGLYRIKHILLFQNSASRNFKIENYSYKEDDPGSIAANDIFALHKDHLGQIWVGTYSNSKGISIIQNPTKEIRFKTYSHNPLDSTSLSDNRVRCIFQDKDLNIWIGTSHGLNYLKSEYVQTIQKKFKQILNDPANKNSLSNNDILHIHQDKKDIIWTATYGGGLNRIIINDKSMSFNHYFRKDGLPSDVVYSILEDGKDNLWLGTDNGLCKFSLVGNQIEIYASKEGTGGNYYSENCGIQTQNGDLIFGQKRGFVRFNPDSIQREKREFPLLLTGFTLFDDWVLPGEKGSPLSSSIETTSKITLKHNQNFIGINFAVMDFKSPEKIRYAYILENFDMKWNYVTNQNNAVYKGLVPGDYKFKIQATNSYGVWMDNTRELDITILPPIWQTKWAYLVYILVTGLIAWFIYYFIIKDIRIRKERLLIEDKLTFFTNISHEFKTPLTLINNSIDDIEGAKSIDKVNDQLKFLRKSTLMLNNLVEQTIDFRKLQKGKMELMVDKIEIVSCFHDIYLTFLPYAKKKNIKFLFKTNVENCEGWVDVRHLIKITYNLLSNAFKHTPEKKKVMLDVQIKKISEMLSFNVIDQGEGIRQDYIDKIFDRFVHLDKDIFKRYKGSGIGLSLSKQLVNLHKGTISVTSEINKGSSFKVEIPIGKDYYQNEERLNTCDKVPSDQILPFVNESEFEGSFNEKDLHIKSSSATRNKLLIIEDSDEMRNYLKDKLKKHFVVLTATNGEEGIQLAIDHAPDLILTDLKMPKMDGNELTKHIKGNFNTSHIPVILLTAKSSVNSKIEGIDVGADDYITKPFHMTYLHKRIENIITQRKKLKEKFSQDPGFEPLKLTVSKNDQTFLTNIINLIEKNISKPDFNIDHVIKEIAVSRSVLYRKMRAIAGCAPKEFIRAIKMKKAAVLLREPDTTISQISFEVGYNDTDYFSKSFKNYFGETPSEYQKKYRK